MALEGSVQRTIWLHLQQFGSRLFRLNTGRGWISSLGPKGVTRLPDGSVLVRAARSIALGFADVKGNPVVGAGDLPGMTTIEITQEMVGCMVGVFTSVEAKRTHGGRVSPEQQGWANFVDSAGGIAVIASSPEEAAKIILNWRPRPRSDSCKI